MSPMNFLDLIVMSFSLTDMSANTSSNDSLLHPNLSSNSSFVSSYLFCLTSSPGSFVFTAFSITHILLLLPLCILILYLGLQQWRKQHSTSTAAMMSHSDSFTYHMVIMELFGVLGYIIFCFGIYLDHFTMCRVGFHLFSLTWYGEMFFHVLTCVERYLAIIHPIIYLSLKGERGVIIRNISIGCVWLLSIGGSSFLLNEKVSIFIEFFCVVLSLAITSFCSLSALRVLIRPGPGEHGGEKENVDKSKLRAYHTILVILVVLMLRFFWGLVWVVPYVIGVGYDCVVTLSAFWFDFPSSLVLPLLFLHRAGRLACCRNTTTKWESGFYSICIEWLNDRFQIHENSKWMMENTGVLLSLKSKVWAKSQIFEKSLNFKFIVRILRKKSEFEKRVRNFEKM